jgi:hypothetical protein
MSLGHIHRSMRTRIASNTELLTFLVFYPLLPLFGIRFLFRLTLPVHRCSTFDRRSAHAVHDTDTCRQKKEELQEQKDTHHSSLDGKREGGRASLIPLFSEEGQFVSLVLRRDPRYNKPRMEPGQKTMGVWSLWSPLFLNHCFLLVRLKRTLSTIQNVHHRHDKNMDIQIGRR